MALSPCGRRRWMGETLRRGREHRAQALAPRRPWVLFTVTCLSHIDSMPGTPRPTEEPRPHRAGGLRSALPKRGAGPTDRPRDRRTASRARARVRSDGGDPNSRARAPARARAQWGGGGTTKPRKDAVFRAGRSRRLRARAAREGCEQMGGDGDGKRAERAFAARRSGARGRGKGRGARKKERARARSRARGASRPAQSASHAPSPPPPARHSARMHGGQPRERRERS